VLKDIRLQHRVETMLEHFGPFDGTSVSDWCTALKDYAIADITAACIVYLAEPRRDVNGAPVRPIPWDITMIIHILRTGTPVKPPRSNITALRLVGTTG
jgi:hypothetical protein